MNYPFYSLKKKKEKTNEMTLSQSELKCISNFIQIEEVVIKFDI